MRENTVRPITWAINYTNLEKVEIERLYYVEWVEKEFPIRLD